MQVDDSILDEWLESISTPPSRPPSRRGFYEDGCSEYVIQITPPSQTHFLPIEEEGDKDYYKLKQNLFTCMQTLILSYKTWMDRIQTEEEMKELKRCFQLQSQFFIQMIHGTNMSKSIQYREFLEFKQDVQSYVKML